MDAEALSAIEHSMQKLVKDYQDLNPSFVQERNSTPTSTEFSKAVAANRPLVFRGLGFRDNVPALHLWSNQYLINKLSGRALTVAASPDGNADSIINDHFVEPASVQMTLDTLFRSFNSTEENGPVYYLQSQNGNLSQEGELHPLLEDVGLSGPSWAAEVFGEPPDVANVWIGDSRSVTSMHKDPYENIYLVIRGSKTFTLMPPTEYYCVHEREYPSATFKFTPPSTFGITPNDPPLETPWIPVDPTCTASSQLVEFPRFRFAKPLTVVLQAGDALYLPALWFHRVAQDVGPSPAATSSSSALVETPAAISVNWWFDMQMAAPLWSMVGFIRRSTRLLDGKFDPPDYEDEE
ncbi:Clavaminate synthase-like protein [Meredithblackwellia eburnea MCA 4105]